MTKRVHFTPLAESLPSTVPFVGPEAQERARGATFAARLGANENGFGPSQAAQDAMARAAREAWQYPDPENHDLARALARSCGVAAQNVAIDTGIDTLLGLLVRLMISSGDSVVTSHGAYPTFLYHVAGFGGTVHTVPYQEDHEDPQALIAKARETGAKLIYFANPDNPMGTVHRADTVAQMIAAVPPGCLLILDEAYVELAPQGTSPDIGADDPRVIRMRTFSKAYGLAGARVGYALGHPDLIAGFNKVRNHFGMSRISQAGAIAALADTDHLAQITTLVSQSRQRIYEIAQANGLTAIPSATNFVAIDCGRDGNYARRVLARLIDAGIFVRMPGIAPLDRCIRVSCGPQNDMALFAKALPQALVDTVQKESA